MSYLKVERKEAEGKIWSHIRKKWLDETPEETVRQEYLCVLVNEYNYSLEQIDEELSVTGRGSGDARADFIIWRTPQDKIDGKTALIVVECKADNVTIDARTYNQGANYAQYERARFFVTHNNTETKYWKVDLTRRMPNFDEIENIPKVDASDTQIEELVNKLKVFKEDEFADLLHQCHNVIRNKEKKDPAASFDEIAKVLFVKVWVERELKKKSKSENLFTAEWLDTQLGENPLNWLFQQTKAFYEADHIFKSDEYINLKPATGREIVRLLERYNLSDTSEDIKGIAFERFLGRTFRGEIGQFFTPRSIVEFMLHMIDPQEGELICDPASGSGGFLIRFFEVVKQKIYLDADKQYQLFKKELEENPELSSAKKAELLRTKYDEIQQMLDINKKDSRLWKLANQYVFGTDANDRMARTSKMNMIMHGDGHGGVYHHDGFLNVNGIFENRFDIILTNPPFGSSVEPTDVVTEEDIFLTPREEIRNKREYGDEYIEARNKLVAALNKPIIDLFELPKSSKIKTEILFIERCLNLLKPGGRLGIVLPEGIFNNPSIPHIRHFVEDRAFIDAVVSVPQDTFKSADADVKCSLLFLRKFTDEEAKEYKICREIGDIEVRFKYQDELSRLKVIINKPNYKQADFLVGMEKPTKERKKKATETSKEENKKLKLERDAAKQALNSLLSQMEIEKRQLLKKLFSYPIFMYEAEKVGITATGEEDKNELYPNDKLPEGVTETALELYRKYKQDPASFILED